MGASLRYWAYLAAKSAVAVLLLYGIWSGINFLLPEPQTFMRQRVSRFPQDLPWTMAMLAFWLLCIGVAYLIAWDQQRRCRICLSRLRMPVEKGSWSLAVLLSPPKLESICPFGHGTLAEPEVHSSGSPPTQWREHEDMWKELEHFEEEKR
jgi:hypothetical protein